GLGAGGRSSGAVAGLDGRRGADIPWHRDSGCARGRARASGASGARRGVHAHRPRGHRGASDRESTRRRRPPDPGSEPGVQPLSVLAASLRGCDARWYPVPRGVLLHAKIGLFDDELVLGSANWTLSGLGVNHELDITPADGGVIAAYRTRFEADWSRSQE